MAALLEKIYREQDANTDPNKYSERAQMLAADLANRPSLKDEIRLRRPVCP